MMPRQDLVSFLYVCVGNELLKTSFPRQLTYMDFRAIAQDHGYEIDDLSPQEARRLIQVFTGKVQSGVSPDEKELYDVAEESYVDQSGIHHVLPGSDSFQESALRTFAFVEDWK